MKTPEDIKKALECCVYHGSCKTCCAYFGGEGKCIGRLERDALSYIWQLENQIADLGKKVPRWIDVDERLPEGDGKYIVCTTKGSVYCAKFSNRHAPYFHTDMNTHIAHWMPMPEPPKEETHD